MKSLIINISVPAKANPPKSKYANSDSILLQWEEIDEGSEPRSYIIRWNPPSENNLSNKLVDGVNETKIKNLIGSSMYSISVQSQNTAGSSTKPSDDAKLVTSNNC